MEALLKANKLLERVVKGCPSAYSTAAVCAGLYGAYRVFKYAVDRYGTSNGEEVNHGKCVPSHLPSAGALALEKPAEKPFLLKLLKLIRIVFPGVLTKEFALLSTHTLALIARSFLNTYLVMLDGQLTKLVVERDPVNFVRLIIKWMAVAVPATFSNSLLKFLEGKLSLALRTRLVAYAYKLYFDRKTYYKVSNLDGRLSSPDECLVEDLRVFSDSVTYLYSHMTKPLLDLMLVVGTLSQMSRDHGQGWVAPVTLGTMIMFGTGEFLKLCSPKFGNLVAEQSAKRGILRSLHSRIITNSEEIAFYSGHKVEQSLLWKSYHALAQQVSKILGKKLWYIMLEQLVMKYIWRATGMFMSLLIMLSSGMNGDPGAMAQRSETYTTSRKLLSTAADSVERFMASYKEISELAGYTDRVYNLLSVFEDVHEDNFVRNYSEKSCLAHPGTGDLQLQYGTVVALSELPKVKASFSDDVICLKDVPIITPAGDVVCPRLTLKITPGMHFLISGPNGCGKSSLFRILSGLWPVYGGELSIPPSSQMFYVPQRPYMTLGSLRDQVIYPDTTDDMMSKGYTDADLEKIMTMVYLQYVVVREGGWDVVNDWMDVLSGGEKQRMAMARMFYHRPKFAMLDECTSAVSIDVEGIIYQSAKDVGITLLTITHRPSLRKFHDHVLQFDGQGGWVVDVLKSEKSPQVEVKSEYIDLSSLHGAPDK